MAENDRSMRQMLILYIFECCSYYFSFRGDFWGWVLGQWNIFKFLNFFLGKLKIRNYNAKEPCVVQASVGGDEGMSLFCC